MHGFHHATILSPTFHCVRKERLAQSPPISDPKTTKIPRGTSRKIGWGCAARFLKPLPYFRPKWSCRQMMKKQLILKKFNSRLECTNHTPFQTKMVEIDTLFQTKTAEKNIPFGAAHAHVSYIRDPPPPPPGAGGMLSVAAYASETKKLDSITILGTCTVTLKHSK